MFTIYNSWHYKSKHIISNKQIFSYIYILATKAVISLIYICAKMYKLSQKGLIVKCGNTSIQYFIKSLQVQEQSILCVIPPHLNKYTVARVRKTIPTPYCRGTNYALSLLIPASQDANIRGPGRNAFDTSCA